MSSSRTGLVGYLATCNEATRKRNAHLLEAGRANRAVLEKAAEEMAERICSNPSVLFFVDSGLPEPTPEYKFHPDRKWRMDFAWPRHMIALEVEGGVWTNGRHTRGSGFVRDMEKYNAAALLGWRVFKCTPDTLLSAATVEMIRGALG